MKRKYVRMIKHMHQSRSILGNKAHQERWFLYMVRCQDETLYTGITKNIEKRIKMHQDGKASRYTRLRRPVKLVYQEPCADRSDALIREYRLKALPRKKKEELIGRP